MGVPRPARWAGSALVLAALTINGAAPALAVTYDCSSCERYCYAGQASNITTVSGITGYITDPSATSLHGESGPNQDHIVLWSGIVENTPSGQQCGADLGVCWEQTGVGEGYVGIPTVHADNTTGSYQAFYENAGPGTWYQVAFFAHAQIPISQGSSYDAQVAYDGMNGHLGEPQYQAFVNGFQTGAGEIFSKSGYAESTTEVRTFSSDCPTLTSGSPWQNFGTDSGGTAHAGNEMYLGSGYPVSYSLWTGNPTVLTNGNNTTGPFYYAKLDGPSAFRTNGPSSGPA